MAASAPVTIPVDRTSPVPLYFQVAQVLEQAIESGRLGPGSRLDNEVLLAEQLGLSRPTVRRAIEYLVDRGLVVRKRGVGTQVAHPRVRRPLELTSLYDDLTTGGREPRTQVLSLAITPAPDTVAHALGLPEGTPVVAAERLRFAQDEPLAIMKNYLPEGLLPLDTAALERTGLYAVLREAGLRPHLASQLIGARTATAAEARLLAAPRATPLLTMRRTAFNDAGRALEYGDHVYRASAYSFELVLVNR